MKRKLIATLLAVLMIVSAIPFSSSAAKSGYVHDEVLNNDNYYHMAYVEGEDFFGEEISLYTALGLYDNAWYNYFDGSVDINYAKTILLGLIEQVEAEYENETYEEVIGVLEGASSAMDVITKVGGYAGKVTDALEFTQSAEWGTTLEVLNTAIKVANYGNEVYEAYVKGYAIILSAQAASAYYGDFLQYLVDNCQNAAVKAAAAEIATTIDQELADATNALVESLVANAGKDAVTLAADVALSSYSVTAAIKTGYKTVVSLSDKVFNTKNKYEYMMSLLETYYIEDCFGAWAEGAFASEDDGFASFAESAVITIRATGEQLLANLAKATTSALIALVKDYNTTEIVIKSASTLAKLDVAKAIFASGIDAPFNTSFTATGKSDVIVQGATDNAILIDDGAALDLTSKAAGVFASVYSDELAEYVKVGYLNGGADYDILLCGAEASGVSYAKVGAYYACVGVCDDRTVSFKNVNTATAAPAFTVEDAGAAAATSAMTAAFSGTVDPIAVVKAGGTTSGGSTSGGSTSGGSSSSPKFSLGDIFKNFFASIAEAFKNLFKIFG